MATNDRLWPRIIYEILKVVYGQILPKKKNQIRIRQLLKYPKGNDASYVEIIGDSHVKLIVTPFVTELINPTSSTGNPVTQAWSDLERFWVYLCWILVSQ